MNYPKFKLESSETNEEKLFLNFLDNPKFPQHKNYIFNSFPKLKESLDNEPENKALVVSNFVTEFYKSNKQNIDKVRKSIRNDVDSTLNSNLSSLGSLMNYEWLEDHEGYKAKLTILPFSPFESNTFFYSILAEIRGSNSHEFQFVAIHEISHFILFAKLKESDFAKELNLTEDQYWVLVHFMKEILAPVLMNQEPLKSSLGIEDYTGNANLRDIFVSQTNEGVQISKFFQNKYEHLVNEKGGSFEDYLSYMIHTLHDVIVSIVEKNRIWGKYGFKIYDNEEILERYREPIQIKNTSSE